MQLSIPASRRSLFAAASGIALALFACSDSHDLTAPQVSAARAPAGRLNSTSTTTDGSNALGVLIAGAATLKNNSVADVSVLPSSPNGTINPALLDMVVVMDASGSITPTGFRNAINATADLIAAEAPSAQRTHMGVIEFATNVQTVYSLTEVQSTSALTSAVDNMSYLATNTSTLSAMTAAVSQLTTAGRPSAAKTIVLVTDGVPDPLITQNPCTLNGSVPAAETLRQNLLANNIQVIVLGVGPDINANTLACLYNFDPTRFITVSDYTNLPNVLTNAVLATTPSVIYTATIPTLPAGVTFVSAVAGVTADTTNGVIHQHPAGPVTVTGNTITWNSTMNGAPLDVQFKTSTLSTALCGSVVLLTNQQASYTGPSVTVPAIALPDYTVAAPNACDSTKPLITPAITGTAGPDGWYSGDIAVHWTVTDPESAISSSSGCGDASITTNTAGTRIICAATSAGGTAADTVVFKRDATQPSVSPSLTGTLGANQWYTSDVAVGWTTSAPGLSGLTTTCPTVVTVTADTPGTPFTCTVTTGAGVSTTATITVKRDASVPVVTAVPQGPLNLVTGWYTGDVSVGWSATASGPSGASAACNVVNITADTPLPGQTLTCTATSGAGVPGNGSITIKRDATVPAVNGTASGTKGSNDWFTSDVGIHFAVSPAGVSGIAATCPDVSLTTDVATATYSCTATTGAGISTKGSVTVKRDATTPVVTGTAKGISGANGWFTGDVTISWSTAGSGPSVGAPCGDEVVTANTAGYTAHCSVTSGAGLTGAGATTIKRDATVPTVAATVTGPPGQNGWYVGNVGVSWTATYGVSGAGASNGCLPATVSADTPGLTLQCSASSMAGLTSPTKTVTIARDATAPVISVAGNAGSYTVDQNIGISCAATDAMSGIASSTCAPVAGPAYAFSTGPNSIPVQATDVAGNVATATIAFNVALTPDAMLALVNRFVTGKSNATLVNRMNNIQDKIGKQSPALSSQVKNFLRELNDAVAAGDVSAANADVLSRLVQQFS